MNAQQSITSEQEKVFQESGLPDCQPHLPGVVRIMHAYAERINGGGEAAEPFTEALEAYIDEALDQVATPDQVNKLAEAAISSENRTSLRNRLTFNSTNEALNNDYRMLASNIGYAYTLSRTAASYFDKSFGYMPDDVQIRLAPGADPKRFVDSKMTVVLGESRVARYRKQVPYSEFIAAGNLYDQRIVANLGRLRAEYEKLEIDFNEEETKRAISDLMFLKTSKVPDAKESIVREFKKTAIENILAQDFTGYQQYLEDFLLQVPEAASSVILKNNGLTIDDVGDIVEYGRNERAVKDAETAVEARKRFIGIRVGREAAHRELRKAMDASAEYWLMYDLDDVEGSVWQVTPLGKDEQPITFGIKGVHLNGYGQAAAWCADVAKDDGAKYTQTTEAKVHIKALALKTLVDLGLVQRVDDAHFETAGRNSRPDQVLGRHDDTLSLYSQVVTSLIRRDPTRPVSVEKVVTMAAAELVKIKSYSINTTAVS